MRKYFRRSSSPAIAVHQWQTDFRGYQMLERLRTIPRTLTALGRNVFPKSNPTNVPGYRGTELLVREESLKSGARTSFLYLPIPVILFPDIFDASVARLSLLGTLLGKTHQGLADLGSFKAPQTAGEPVIRDPSLLTGSTDTVWLSQDEKRGGYFRIRFCAGSFTVSSLTACRKTFVSLVGDKKRTFRRGQNSTPHRDPALER